MSRSAFISCAQHNKFSMLNNTSTSKPTLFPFWASLFRLHNTFWLDSADSIALNNFIILKYARYLVQLRGAVYMIKGGQNRALGRRNKDVERREATFTFHTEITRGHMRFDHLPAVKDSASYSKPRGKVFVLQTHLTSDQTRQYCSVSAKTILRSVMRCHTSYRRASYCVATGKSDGSGALWVALFRHGKIGSR